MTIQVRPDGRILVNGIQNGVRYHSVALANSEAKKLQAKHYPHATVIECPNHNASNPTAK